MEYVSDILISFFAGCISGIVLVCVMSMKVIDEEITKEFDEDA